MVFLDHEGVSSPPFLSSASRYSYHLIVQMIALLHIGISAGTIACIGYVSEVAGESASDAVALVTFIKSVIGFGIIFFANDCE